MLEASSDWFRFVLETMDEGIHVVDGHGVTVVYNSAASRMDGVAPAEVLGKHVLSVFPSLGQETSTLLQVLRSGRAIAHQPQTYTNVKGIQIHTVNTTLPIKSGKSVIGALEIAKDLTQVKHLSDQVLHLQSRVAQTKATQRNRIAPPLYTFADIITEDAHLLALLRRAERVARTSSPVLVYGETGTGKELLVQAIHAASPNASEPFLAMNCAALPASLVEGILFGSVRGSYTGAEDRKGMFELAGGGTLFLDEVQSLPLDLQAKLLRVLQSGEFYKVGDTKPLYADVRVLTAMNVDPDEAINRHELRPDLYYRISVIRFDLPPLRQRLADIPHLTAHFIKKWNAKFSRKVEGVTKDVMQHFHAYPWPGNVRELEHAIEGALNLCDRGLIDVDLLPHRVQGAGGRMQNKRTSEGSGAHVGGVSGAHADNSACANKSAGNNDNSPYGAWADVLLTEGMNEFWGSLEGDIWPASIPSLIDVQEAFERMILSRTLAFCQGNVRQSAARLHIPRQTLQYRMKQLGLK